MSSVARLGYLGLEVRKPDDGVAFATRVLGMEVRPPAVDGAIPLRYDDPAQRIRLHQGKADDIIYLGLEVADKSALAELTRRVEAAGTAQEPTPWRAVQRAAWAALKRPERA